MHMLKFIIAFPNYDTVTNNDKHKIDNKPINNVSIMFVSITKKLLSHV